MSRREQMTGNAAKEIRKEQKDERPFNDLEDTGGAVLATMKVPNPVYEKLKVQLVQAEEALAAVESRLVNQKKQVEKWL